MFTKLYQNRQDRFSGDPDQSFQTYETTFILNMIASKVHSKKAVSVVHKTLHGIALDVYILQFGSTNFARAEDALAALGSCFMDDSSVDRAYGIFHSLVFSSFRKQRGVKDVSEAEAVEMFYSRLLSCQMQLDAIYHSDEHLRDRLVLVFSTYSKVVKESFVNRRPKTSHQVLQRISQRSSLELGVDLLPDKDVDVLRTDVATYYLDEKLKERAGSAEKFKKRGKRRPRAGCWVCKSRDHYANERHTQLEIDAAKGQGKSAIAYAAELSSKRGVRVLNAHIKALQSSSSEGSESSDKSEDDVAEVSDVNFTRIDKDSSNIDAVEFNRDAARAAAYSALVFAISSSWKQTCPEK
jgi:hypothetical protein